MERIGSALSTDADGTPCTPVIVTPRPVGGLVTRRVLVMDFLPGVPLSRAVEEMARRGIDPDSAEAQLFGRNLLSALTAAFGRFTKGYRSGPSTCKSSTLLVGDIFYLGFLPLLGYRQPRYPSYEPHTLCVSDPIRWTLSIKP